MGYDSLLDRLSQDFDNNKNLSNQINNLSEINRSAITKKLINLIRAPINGITLNFFNEKESKKNIINISENHSISKN